MSIPHIIGNAKVIATAIVALLTTKDASENLVYALAICKCESEEVFYLFSCDDQWIEFADTWHETIEDAQDQAEYQYRGITGHWIFL